MTYRVTQDYEDTTERGDAATIAQHVATYCQDMAELFEEGEAIPTTLQLYRQISELEPGHTLHVLDLNITPETAEGFTRYYHDRAAGEYHAIEYTTQPRAYRAVFRIDTATGKPRTYSGPLPTLRAARRILAALAPDAVELPGLPAWLR